MTLDTNPLAEPDNLGPLCGSCLDAVAEDCADSLARLGVIKVCWECWSECNLACRFCFRSHSLPLGTSEAVRLLRVLATGGVKQIVFAGGDPSLRNDLPLLVRAAHSLKIKVEIQTNAQHRPASLLEALSEADLVGVSLDGATANAHDTMRSKRGNFRAVTGLLQWLADTNKPVVVRTIVTKANVEQPVHIGELISHYDNVRRWSLMQFSAVQDGFANREEFELDELSFEVSAMAGKNSYRGHAEVDVYFERQKRGTYLLITSSGDVYGHEDTTIAGYYPVVGNILQDHLALLATKLPFSPENHTRRFGRLLLG